MSSPTSISKPKLSSLLSASALITDTTRASHILKIDGYARTKSIPTGEYLKSVSFTVGGHRWRIHYYPNGRDDSTASYISLFLVLKSSVDDNDPVKVQYALRFADEDADESLETSKLVRYRSHNAFGYSRFIRRSVLERSKHLRDDAFTIQCDMIIVRFFGEEVSTTTVPMPSSNLQQHLRDLLETKQGADVAFQVGGETLAAHRWMLAARSPVFNAELFGTMREGSTGVVVIDDMEAAVFKALLHFIYTDLLPEMNGEEEFIMSQHLLVASDKYNLDRLKYMCEHNLCKHIEPSNVMILLELAEQHRCQGLKNACFEFLSAPMHLEAALATDSFKLMSRSYPSIMMELVAKLGTQQVRQ
ncbi:unnamed protein product [Urochloa humidicola]